MGMVGHPAWKSCFSCITLPLQCSWVAWECQCPGKWDRGGHLDLCGEFGTGLPAGQSLLRTEMSSSVNLSVQSILNCQVWKMGLRHCIRPGGHVAQWLRAWIPEPDCLWGGCHLGLCDLTQVASLLCASLLSSVKWDHHSPISVHWQLYRINKSTWEKFLNSLAHPKCSMALAGTISRSLWGQKNPSEEKERSKQQRTV